MRCCHCTRFYFFVVLVNGDHFCTTGVILAGYNTSIWQYFHDVKNYHPSRSVPRFRRDPKSCTSSNGCRCVVVFKVRSKSYRHAHQKRNIKQRRLASFLSFVTSFSMVAILAHALRHTSSWYVEARTSISRPENKRQLYKSLRTSTILIKNPANFGTTNCRILKRRKLAIDVKELIVPSATLIVSVLSKVL